MSTPRGLAQADFTLVSGDHQQHPPEPLPGVLCPFLAGGAVPEALQPMLGEYGFLSAGR